MESLGIIAGSGQFPVMVARRARASGMRVVICALKGNAGTELEKEADAFVMLSLGQLGTLINFFKKNAVNRACMAGAVSKPKAMDIKPDMRVAKLIFKLAGNRGDDAILRAVVEELKSEGIEIVPPDALVPNLRSDSGILTGTGPDAKIWADIRFGWKMAKSIGVLDIGQCVVVREGIVMAVEAIEGTDAALTRGGELGGAGCTLVKVVKPGQDTRLDLPSIGISTVELLARHSFSCLAFEADGALFFDREAALALAEKHDLVVVAVPGDGEAFFDKHDF